MSPDERDANDLRQDLTRVLDRISRGTPDAGGLFDQIVTAVNPIDLAGVLPDLEDEQINTVFDRLDPERRAVVLAESDPRIQALLLLHVGDQGAELVSTLEPDDAADVLERLPESEREEILQGMEETDAREIRELTSYDPETAGGLMTPEFVSVEPDQTVDQVLQHLRGAGDEAEDVSNVYVLEKGRLSGVFSLRELIRAPAERLIAEVMTRDVIRVRTDQDREDVVRLMETYHLSSIPVVDAGDRLLGIITFDDALTAMEEEGSEDVMTMAGAGSVETFPTRQTVKQRVLQRIPWLMVTLAGGMACALIVPALYAMLGEAEEVSENSLFFVMIAGMAGSVATQSAAVMVRGFAIGEIGKGRTRRIIFEESLVGLLVGFLVGLGASVTVYLLNLTGVLELENTTMPITLFFSFLIATTIAGIGGTLIPSVCERFGVDPAISAGPFLTALNDVTGLSIFVSVSVLVRTLLGG